MKLTEESKHHKNGKCTLSSKLNAGHPWLSS